MGVRRLIRSSVPTILSLISVNIILIITMRFLNYQSEDVNVAGLGLAWSTVNMVMTPVIAGLGATQTIQVAQSIGADEGHMR